MSFRAVCSSQGDNLCWVFLSLTLSGVCGSSFLTRTEAASVVRAQTEPRDPVWFHYIYLYGFLLIMRECWLSIHDNDVRFPFPYKIHLLLMKSEFTEAPFNLFCLKVPSKQATFLWKYHCMGSSTRILSITVFMVLRNTHARVAQMQSTSDIPRASRTLQI